MNDLAPVRHIAPTTAPVSPAKFAHFVLRTGQIDRLVEWYQAVLNARIVFRNEMLCFLSYDDEHHRLALINIPGSPPRDPNGTGTDHVAYSYNDLGELLSTYRRLKERGITPHWPINHGVTTSMYYRDPDNNRVELQIDNFRPSKNCRVISRAKHSPQIRLVSPTIPSNCAAITKPACRWRICCVSRRCPKARPRWIC
jgi:catechol-2,3-dioxygenase